MKVLFSLSDDNIRRFWSRLGRLSMAKFVEMAVINLLDDLDDAEETEMWSTEELMRDLSAKTKKSEPMGRPGRPVLRVEDGVVFESAGKAAEAVKGVVPSIYGVINGKGKTAYGYHWKWAD